MESRYQTETGRTDRMPMKPKSPCLQQGCGALVDRGRCPAHTIERTQQTYAERNADPVSKLYRTAAWSNFRKYFFRRHPICQRVIDGVRCLRIATLLHHKKSPRECPDLFLDEDNVVALCAAHHHKKAGDTREDVFAVDNW
jgi:5-methylcytosine-specific restriction protein A